MLPAGFNAAVRELIKKQTSTGTTGTTAAASATIQRGRVSGDYVIINSRTYAYDLAVDINVKDGMHVWAEIAGGVAVIVGA